MAPHASTLVTLGIPGIALLAAGLFVLAVGVAARKLGAPAPRQRRCVAWALLGAASWLALSGALAHWGILSRFDQRPPLLMPFMVAVLTLGCALGLSPVGALLARGLPLAALVGAQALRLPLELVMHRAAQEGVMPVEMSFSGWNFDIVTGTTAAILGAWLAWGRPPRAVVLAWNALGFFTLAAITVIAVASTPLVHAFGTAPEKLNTWVAYFPFIWLPAGPVVFALAGHIVVARRLRLA